MLINRIGILLRQSRQVNTNRNTATAVRRTKLLDSYQKYQTEDGTPVYLKGGLMDKMLFQATVGLCIFGLANGASTIFTLAKPKKK